MENSLSFFGLKLPPNDDRPLPANARIFLAAFLPTVVSLLLLYIFVWPTWSEVIQGFLNSPHLIGVVVSAIYLVIIGMHAGITVLAMFVGAVIAAGLLWKSWFTALAGGFVAQALGLLTGATLGTILFIVAAIVKM